MEKRVIKICATLFMASLLASCGPSQAEIDAQSTEAALYTSGTLTAQAPTQTPVPTITPTPTLGVGSTLISEVDGMEMVYVPEGSFLMGSNLENQFYEWNTFGESSPQHEVFLDAFWIDQTEVTNAMFAAFLNAEGNQIEDGETWLDAGDEEVRIKQANGQWQAFSSHEDHPVVEVNWYGAAAYCEWVGRRLPTEAEWEKAARGENGQMFPWGDEFDSSLANLDDEIIISRFKIDCTASGCDGFNGTSPVGSFPEGASPYGALGMAGNVMEWVADWHDKNYYDENPPYLNPQGPSSGKSKGIRGCSFAFGACFGTPADRWFSAAQRGSLMDTGFRCVLDVSQ